MNITDGPSAAAEARTQMSGQIEHVRHELAGVRTGRASIGILDSVRVDAYGSQMPLNQVASLSVPESTLLVAESGIRSRADVEYLAGGGVSAVLVGETLMRAESVLEKTTELVGVPRR